MSWQRLTAVLPRHRRSGPRDIIVSFGGGQVTNSRSHMSLAVRVAVVSFLVAFSAAAAVHEHQAEADPSAFAARLKKILATTPEAERFDDDLFDNHLMREVITDPERFLPQIEAYLASGPGISRAEARLSLISVQCLALPDYLA